MRSLTETELRCMFCKSGELTLVHRYHAPPPIEVCFDLVDGKTYQRELLRCAHCGHFYSLHDMDFSAIYDGAYADANYAGDKMRQTFDRIVSLPPERSDNTWRVKRVRDYAYPILEARGLLETLLDVGSGLAVFPYAMKGAGWHVTALDPDPRQSAHARDVAGVTSIHGDFMTLDTPGRYGLVSFNKVLEHIEDPVSMLRRSRDCLEAGGICYVELPDGEMAIRDADGPNREEFLIDHPHIFSAASMTLLAQKAGFRVDELRRIREPSGKYTLYMFLSDNSA